MKVPIDDFRGFQPVYGSLSLTVAVWRSTPVHLGERVWTLITQSFVYTGDYYFTEASEGMVRFWYVLEVNQFLS